MITKKNREVMITLMVMLGFALLVFGSVVIDYNKVDMIYLFILMFFIVKYSIYAESK